MRRRGRFWWLAVSNGYRWLTGVLDHFLRAVAVVALCGTPLVILAIHHGHHLWLIGVSAGAVLLVCLAEGAYASWDDTDKQLADAQATLDRRKDKAILLENLARKLILGGHTEPVALWWYRAESPDEYEEQVEEAARKAQGWARSTYEFIRDKIGWDEAALFESDYGLPSEYDGPSSYLPDEEAIKKYVARRCLRLEQIMVRLRGSD